MASLQMKDHSESEEADFNSSDLDSEITDGQIDDLSDLCDDDLSADLFDSDVLNVGDHKPSGVEGNDGSHLKTNGSGSQPLAMEKTATASSTDFGGGLLSRNLLDNLRNSELLAPTGKRDADEISVGSKKRTLEETFNRFERSAMSKRNPIRRHSIHNIDVGTHRTFTDLMDPDSLGHDGGEEGEFGGGKRRKDKPVRSSSVGALDQSILAGIDFNNLDSESSDSEDEESSDGSDHNSFFFRNIIPRYQKSSSLPTPQQLASSNFPAAASSMSNMGQSHISQQAAPFPDQSNATTTQQQALHSAAPMSNSNTATSNNGFHDSTSSFAGNQMPTPFNSTYNAAGSESPMTNMQPYYSEQTSTIPMQSQVAAQSMNGFQPDFAAALAQQVTQQQPQQRPNFEPQPLLGMPVNPSPFTQPSPDTNPNHHVNQMPPQAQEQPPAEIDQAAMMVKLSALMDRSMATQKSLQEWDKANGLPRSHSQTMVKSNRSRRQLQEGVILKKWDGSPLINFDKDGKVKDDGKKKRQTKKSAKKTTASKKSESSPSSSSKDLTTEIDLTDDSLEPLAH